MAAVILLLIAIGGLSGALALNLLVVWIGRAALRAQDEKRSSSTLPRYVALALAIAATTYIWPTRPLLLESRQVRTHIRCQGYYSFLFRYRDHHGGFPAALEEIEAPEGYQPIDGWGNRLDYESDGQGFILASFGRDGQPDGVDYDALRQEGSHPSGYNICGNFDADEVLSDQGWHRLCGK